MDHMAVIDFWFAEVTPGERWGKDAGLDRRIGERFGATLEAARQCELYPWRAHHLGRLAEIIVLDQFSRHIFRERPGAFAQDPLALCLAQQAVALRVQDHLSDDQKAFLYMPFMHSESARIQALSVALFAEPGLEENYGYALRHREIIDRFGRYPHRNAILGRESSDEETAFLKEPGSAF